MYRLATVFELASVCPPPQGLSGAPNLDEGFYIWLIGVRHPLRYNSRIFAKQFGKLLVVHVLLSKNYSYSIQKFTLHLVDIDFSHKDKLVLLDLFVLP